MNGNQFEISTENRRQEIITYIINQQGCTRADLERGLKHSAKNTMNKLVRIMIKERILKEDRKNKKKIKLFVNKNNLLGSVPQELEQFKSAFIPLVDKTIEKIIAPSIIKTAFEDENSISNDIVAELIPQLSEERLSLFFRMVDSILIRSLTEWPRRIHDRETLKKLYHTVFTKISDMLIDIAEQHEIPSFAMEYSLQKIALTKLRGGSLFEYWKKFQNYGMQQEVEKVIDALWDMDKDIQQIVHKDLEYISQERGLNFEFSSNNWRKLFEMIENTAKS